MQLTTNM